MERPKKMGRIGQVRPAFTLVELLVVITIIGMLMALLMPAISAARERGRCVQCLSNQKEIAVAMAAFESAKQAFPGWRNSVSTTPSGTASPPPTWLAMLLPNLDRNDLWQQKVKPQNTWGTFVAAGNATFLKLLACPSDPPAITTGIGPSAYVANGLVLRDQYQYQQSSGSNGALAPQTLDYVSANDGTSTTLMLSEVTQTPPTAAAAASAVAKAHNWYDADANNPSSFQIKQTFGFPITGSVYAAALVTFASQYGTQSSAYNGNTMTSNINSSHSGGANVVFFDQHGLFLRDDAGLNVTTSGSLTATVFQILATPEGSKNGTEPPCDEGAY